MATSKLVVIPVNGAVTRVDDAGERGAYNKRVRIRNSGTVVLQIGGSNLSAANGYRMAVGDQFELSMETGEELYARNADAVTAGEISFLETS